MKKLDRPSMRSRAASCVAIAIAMLLVSGLAFAGNTYFLTDRNGAIQFPISPPNRANSTPGAIDNMTIGATTPAPGTFTNLNASSITNSNPTPLVQGAPNAQTVSATLTAANLQAGIITVAQGSGANSNLQLPLATAMDTAFPNSVANSAFDFSIINIGGASETATVTTNTGWTLVGGVVIAVPGTGSDSSVRFRARKTGTGAWTLYRLG